MGVLKLFYIALRGGLVKKQPEVCDGPLLTAEVLLSMTPTRNDARVAAAAADGCRDFHWLYSLCWGSLRWLSAGRALPLQRCTSSAGIGPDIVQGSASHQGTADGMMRSGWASRGQQSPEQGCERPLRSRSRRFASTRWFLQRGLSTEQLLLPCPHQEPSEQQGPPECTSHEEFCASISLAGV